MIESIRQSASSSPPVCQAAGSRMFCFHWPANRLDVLACWCHAWHRLRRRVVRRHSVGVGIALYANVVFVNEGHHGGADTLAALFGKTWR